MKQRIESKRVAKQNLSVEQRQAIENAKNINILFKFVGKSIERDLKTDKILKAFETLAKRTAFCNNEIVKTLNRANIEILNLQKQVKELQKKVLTKQK